MINEATMWVGGQPLLRRVRNNRIKKKLCGKEGDGVTEREVVGDGDGKEGSG